jgi:hypothetical protein
LKVLKMGIFAFLPIYKGIQSMYKVVRIAVLTAVLFHIDKIAEI